MAETIRWGVIGSGGIARRRTIPEGLMQADNAELVSVYDVNKKANAEVADETGAEAAEGIEALLASDLDAVYIATPAYLHAEQVLACAETGKHVLCEKPLGMSVEETEGMIDACRRAGVELGCAFMMRYVQQHLAAATLVEQGKLGTPTFARAQLSCWYPPMDGAWRQDPTLGGGGSLIDMGGHCIDTLEMILGEVTSVSCMVNNTVHNYKSEDSAVAMLRFACGAIGVVDTFFCIPDAASKNRLELYGSLGSILAEGTLGQAAAGTMTALLEEAGGGYDAQQARSDAAGQEIAPEPVNTYRAEVEDFSRHLLEGKSLAWSAELGLRSQAILSACYESAKTGRTVDV